MKDNENKNKEKNNGIKLDESTLEDVDTKLFNFEDLDDEDNKDFYDFDASNSKFNFNPIGSVGNDESDIFKKSTERKPKSRLEQMLDSREEEVFGRKIDREPPVFSAPKPKKQQEPKKVQPQKKSLEDSFEERANSEVKDEIISIFEDEKPMFNDEYVEEKPVISQQPKINSRDEITIFESDKDTNEQTIVDEVKVKSLMESAFYVYGNEGLSLNDLKKLTLAPTATIKKILKNWIETLEKDTTRGITIKLFGDKYKFFTKTDNREELSRLITIKYRNPLSQKVMETLAIIAYNQPCTKSIIENIRGKDPTMTIQKLIDLGLVNEAGRGDGPGRPLLFTVSHKFYDIFGIKNVSELPRINLDQPFQDDDISFFDTTRFND